MDSSNYSDYYDTGSYEFYAYSANYSYNAGDEGYDSYVPSASFDQEVRINNREDDIIIEEDDTDAISQDKKNYENIHHFMKEEIMYIKSFQSINVDEDIKNKLTEQLLDEAREYFWKQDENGDFETLYKAMEGNEIEVAFALYIAKSHKTLNQRDRYRQTVLHILAERGSSELCRLYITRGADGAIADIWGDTALHIASKNGRADVIKALTTVLTKPEVKHPYFRVPYKSLPQDNVQTRNHDGRAPVHLAAKTGSAKALRALVRHARADINYLKFGNGYAPIHIAIENNDMDCIKQCLKLGADSEVRNYKSQTPQQMAYLINGKNRNGDIVKLCQEYKAHEYQLDYAEDTDNDENDFVSTDDNDDDACSALEKMEI